MGKLTTKSASRLSDSSRFQGKLDSADPALPIVCQNNLSLLAGAHTLDASNDAGQETFVTITTANPKARQHTPQARERRRVVKDRVANFEAAARHAYEIDRPLTLAITINWTALIQAGERNAGHCLGRDEGAREAYLRAELSRCRPKTAPSTPFVAVWGRDIGHRMGIHTHIGLHCSFRHPDHLAALVAMLERICGSSVAPCVGWADDNVLAESFCKGWQVKRIYGDTLLSGALRWVNYIARQWERHNEWPNLEGKAFGVSHAIGPAARASWHSLHGLAAPS